MSEYYSVRNSMPPLNQRMKIHFQNVKNVVYFFIFADMILAVVNWSAEQHFLAESLANDRRCRRI